TVAGTTWGATESPTAQFIKPLPQLLAGACMLGIALGAVAANVINIYSGAMSFLSLGIRELGFTLRQRRAVVAVGTGVIGFAVGVLGQSNVAPGSKYEFFLLLISSWIAPWLAVGLVDSLPRRGAYGDERMFYDTWPSPLRGF